MDAAGFAATLDRHLSRTPHAQVGVRAPALGLEYEAGPTLPFHAASVGKLATTVLVGQLVEADARGWGPRVVDVPGPAEVRGLFTDPDAVTIEHLLTHTSGVADYFEGKVTHGVPVWKEAIAHPERRWTPAELLAVTRERQRPVGRPGQRFAYSDTGFVLLGRVLEEVTGSAFEALVHERIAGPLGLDSMFLPERTVPTTGSTEIVPLVLDRTDVSRSPSLTCDWAGGGIAATTTDWLTFGAALFDGRLVAPDTLGVLTGPQNKFRSGLDYGAGTMTVRFEGFVPWARGWPRLVGHLGISAAHLWHDPASGAAITINLGWTRQMTRSFRVLFAVVQQLRKLAAS